MQHNIKPIKHENNMQTFLFNFTEIHEPADSTFKTQQHSDSIFTSQQVQHSI